MINLNNKNLVKAIDKLKKVYNEIPSTTGCMENIAKTDGCKAWCCNYQSPSVLSVEFHNVWKHILNIWKPKDICNLVERSLRNYLSSNTTKGCVMWDKNTKLCQIHKHRPYNCRTYGIIPEEEFKPRFERLKILYQNDLSAIVRDQCNLVKTEDGSSVTKEMTEKWWKEMLSIEKKSGVSKENINDSKTGTYRTYHDHIVLRLLSDNMLAKMTYLKIHGNEMDKEQAVNGVINGLRLSLEEKACQKEELP